MIPSYIIINIDIFYEKIVKKIQIRYSGCLIILLTAIIFIYTSYNIKFLLIPKKPQHES